MIFWHWGDDAEIGRPVRHRGEIEDCSSPGCIDTGEREEPMTEKEWTAQEHDLARRMNVFSLLERVSGIRESLCATSRQTGDPRVREAYRHFSYACHLMFLYGNEIETVPVPDFESWEN